MELEPLDIQTRIILWCGLPLSYALQTSIHTGARFTLCAQR